MRRNIAVTAHPPRPQQVAGGKKQVARNTWRKRMVGRVQHGGEHPALSRARGRGWRVLAIALGALGLAATVNSALPQAQQPQEEEEEYGEFLARHEELASVPVNDIVKSIRMNGSAMLLGKKVYDKACASCHGADLKGAPGMHAPDLTDADWQYSGDDLASGGLVKFPSDVEWTVRYGIRSEHPNARGLEADMLAFNPKYRTEEDTKEFSDKEFLTADQIADVVEYVLELSGQPSEHVKAARGKVLFHDGTTGNCFDCHGEDATGNAPIGSTNLTDKRLYLYGADRASINESITRGRRGVMPAFEGTLKPEEIKAVSVYVFSRAAK
jgi:cbb3-type cytochrome c oxidase subunit III